MKIGEHTVAAILNGGQLLVRQSSRLRGGFDAQMTFANAKGIGTGVCRTPDHALEDLEEILRSESES